jgi:hypothetical protein
MAKVIVGVADTPAKDGVSSRYEQGGTCSETNRSELVPHVGQRAHRHRRFRCRALRHRAGNRP